MTYSPNLLLRKFVCSFVRSFSGSLNPCQRLNLVMYARWLLVVAIGVAVTQGRNEEDKRDSTQVARCDSTQTQTLKNNHCDTTVFSIDFDLGDGAIIAGAHTPLPYFLIARSMIYSTPLGIGRCTG